MSRLIIYHANCVDGFTAAWCCWQLWPNAEFVAAQYGDDPPDVSGRDVVIVDFSYPRNVLLQMHEQADSLIVLDHHKTAAEDLAGLDFATFDMDRSGAGLAWDELGSGQRPLLVDYVEDRDLWRWALADSKEISAFIALHERTFNDWERLDDDLHWRLPECIASGKSALRVTDQYVDSHAVKHRVARIGGFLVPCVNTTFAISELVGELAEHFPFAAGWFERSDGKIVYSLRSRGELGADVSEIAKQYGGGGHRNAAGFTVNYPVHWLSDQEES